MQELMLTLGAIYERQNKEFEFNAALQGVDISQHKEEKNQDVTTLVGYEANQIGFGIGQGLGLMEEN